MKRGYSREIAMVEKNEVVKGIWAILAKLNEEMDLALTVSAEMPLIGGESGIDSVAFLNMISLIEEWLDRKYGCYSPIIAPDENFSPTGTFGSIDRLAEHLVKLIEEEREGSV